jgi:hypothetical protein
MICQDCGVEAATKQVSFHQNIGALIVRFPKSVEGSLCKSCIHKHFWGMTGTTLFLGWWGTISFFVTPFFLLNNIARYLFCLPMPPVPAGAQAPRLTNEAVERIKPHAPDLFNYLNKGEDLETVTSVIAAKAGVTPGQVVLFVQAVVRAQSEG